MEMGRGAKNCSTTIMNRKKIGEAPQFVKKTSSKMAIFQLEHLTLIRMAVLKTPHAAQIGPQNELSLTIFSGA